ncbi:MAG: methylenetetrahydrofolate reductase [NAD(P)H] [Boseongicola sp. SB0676_bin_33]|nr:methylenetetrahydrofolate reductase [NAD(P)H] [Boseongicola sp. SB0676_bin_33]
MHLPGLSFEFFPPQGVQASFRLWEAVSELSPLGPEFVSVTFGAGGAQHDLTLETVKAIMIRFDLNVAAHLTCSGATRETTLAVADSYSDAGVREIVALRGDPPSGADAFRPHHDGFEDSCELISALAHLNQFSIRASAYPDPHPESPAPGADVEWLKRKVDAGASSAITQFFFEAESYFRFRDACDAARIDVPIIPGILPIEDWRRMKRFAKRCGAHVPAWLADAFEVALRDDRHDLLAISVCTELCSDLLDGGVEHLHFYTLNKPHLTREVVRALRAAPTADLRYVA